jgi:F-type H+-transporting ATPase subunit a
MKFSFAAVVALLAGSAHGAGGLPSFINYYDLIVVKTLGLPGDVRLIAGGLLVLLLVSAVGIYFKSSIQKSGDDIKPSSRFSLRVLIEAILDMLYGLTKDQCGDGFRRFLPILAGIFFFILFSNLTGLIPGFPPPTESMSTNVAIGLISFIVYNAAGLKEHGVSYFKQFMGPVWWLIPLFLVIEIFSHFSRPLSLGLRLMGNIYGDHMLVAVFTKLTWVGFPALLLFFGLLVAVIQSFVFTLLTSIYISMATSHDH